MGTPSDDFTFTLSDQNRVLLIGGLAIVAYGLSRPTDDADIWLDSVLPLGDWIATLRSVLVSFPNAYFWDLASRERVTEIRGVIEDFGVIRIGGLDRAIDIFRKPNQLDESDFDAAWEISSPHLGNIRLLEETYLIASKVDTERDKDQYDIHFLENRLRETLSPRLLTCTHLEAKQIFSRYLDHVTALAALENPDPAVQALALDLLRELAAANNPFAVEALQKRGLL